MYEKLRAGLERLMEARPEDTRLYTEVAILADKQDINEEVQRLRDHIDKFKQLADSDGQTGKQLDFLAQEFNREVNTTCSKANDLELTNIGLEMKSVVEQFREQVQNLE